MNFALLIVSKGKEESMSNGLYRPYFHGELVVEYRKSIKLKHTQEPPTNDVEVNSVQTQNHVEQVEKYVEPGIRAIFADLLKSRR
jgi:hypothetical protein